MDTYAQSCFNYIYSFACYLPIKPINAVLSAERTNLVRHVTPTIADYKSVILDGTVK